jgi:nucleotidyltransferase/DNA polymerase involved in DNA repair
MVEPLDEAYLDVTQNKKGPSASILAEEIRLRILMKWV